MRNAHTILLLAGCLIATLFFGCQIAPKYKISVNGYLDKQEDRSFEKGEVFYVFDGENIENPLLDKELKNKIAAILEKAGYKTGELEEAKYVVRFRYGGSTGLKQVVRYEPYHWRAGCYYGHHWHCHPWMYHGGGEWVTYMQAEHRHYLTLSIVDADQYRKDRSGQIFWVGEALSRSPSSDIRTALTYLLVALFEYFGQDTSQAKAITIKTGDPRVLIL